MDNGRGGCLTAMIVGIVYVVLVVCLSVLP